MRNQTIKAKAEHDKFLQRMGVDKDSLRATRTERKKARKKDFTKSYAVGLKVEQNAPLSNMSESVSGDSYTKRSILDKPGPNATSREIKAWHEAVQKAARTAPAYNKGGYMYITPEADLASLGRKV